MKSVFQNKIRFVYLGCILLLVLVVTTILLVRLNDRRNYNDLGFKKYKESVIYCGSFWGGNTLSDRDIYDRWKQNKVIGC